MKPKANTHRFTIKFNDANPHHKEAARILNEVGRVKADLIAAALLFYIQNAVDVRATLLKREPPPINAPPLTHAASEPQREFAATPMLTDASNGRPDAEQPTETDLAAAINDSLSMLNN